MREKPFEREGKGSFRCDIFQGKSPGDEVPGDEVGPKPHFPFPFKHLPRRLS